MQMFCVFTIFILLKGVDLHPKGHPFLSSMFSWSKFCADAMYLEGGEGKKKKERDVFISGHSWKMCKSEFQILPE